MTVKPLLYPRQPDASRASLGSRILLVSAVAVFCSMWIAESRADFAQTVSKRMRAIEDSLCQKLKSPKCRQAKPARNTKAAPRKAKAEEEAQTIIPIPRPNPLRVATKAEPDETNAAIPIPRAKPAGLTGEDKSGDKVATLSPPPPKVKPAARQADCHKSLAQLGAKFDIKPTPVSAGACAVSDPVVLQSLTANGAVIELPDRPLLNCAFALTFATWVDEKGAEVVAKLGSPLAKLYTGPGYECRGRNGDASAKISEHGYGNAVDITFFKLKNGTTVEVKGASNQQSGNYAALGEMRRSACGYFSTVLGPGANAAHAEHFHFDAGKHGSSGTYRICQ
jgi:hypothetical protein